MKSLFKDNKSAIQIIIEASQKHSDASESGDYRTANKNYDLVKKAVEYLREKNQIIELKELLQYSNISVRITSASYLLKHFEKEAIDTLEEIANDSIPHKSFEARMVLKEWRKGALNI